MYPNFSKNVSKSENSFNVGSPGISISGFHTLPNNCVANLVIFWGKKTYTTLLGPTRLVISEIFPSKSDFHLYK